MTDFLRLGPGGAAVGPCVLLSLAISGCSGEGGTNSESSGQTGTTDTTMTGEATPSDGPINNGSGGTANSDNVGRPEETTDRVDLPAPAHFPLIVAAEVHQFSVWKNAHAVADGAEADFAITVPGGLGVVGTRERLGVLTREGLFLYDTPGELSAGSTPSQTIPASVFGVDLNTGFNDQVIDQAGDLWITYGDGRVALFKDFNSLSSASTPAAVFTHEWGQITSAAYHEASDTLFANQVSGAGLLAFSGAKSASGAVSTSTSFSEFTGWHSEVSGDTLLIGGPDLGVWHGLGGALSPTAPSVTTAVSGMQMDVEGGAVALALVDTINFHADVSAISASSASQTLVMENFVEGIAMSKDTSSLIGVGHEGVYVVGRDATGLTLQKTLPLHDYGSDVEYFE